MKDGDGIFMTNFRADRARQILEALFDSHFDAFPTQKVNFKTALGLVEYSEKHNQWLTTLFAPETPQETIGEIVSAHGLKQLRIAETEKYAHVTFFFNGGREDTFPGEDRILVPSPKVATYDLKPEMSATEVTDQLVSAIESGKYDFIVVNYANGDMVGHTGNVDAAIKAVETVDQCISRVWKAVKAQCGTMIITADHGNAEMMYDHHESSPHTAHTLNPVPFLLLNETLQGIQLKDGKLSDVAPTILDIMGLEKPVQMTGTSLIQGEGRLHECA